MARWKFQLIPNTKNLLGRGSRMDAIGESVEMEVNDALPHLFRFHGVSKIVLWLGQPTTAEPDYAELLGVALKQMPKFSIPRYMKASVERKNALLRATVLEAFAWFENEFSDAQFIDIARSRLPWNASQSAVPSRPKRSVRRKVAR